MFGTAAAAALRCARDTAQRPYLARTTHGLEDLAGTELTATGHTVVEVTKRQIVLVAPGDAPAPVPRTVDDLFDLVAALPDPGPTRAGLAALAPLVRDALRGSAAAMPGSHISVSASATGRRAYSRFDIEDLVGGLVGGRDRYRSRRDGRRPPPGSLDWRVTIDPRAGMLIGIRTTDRPLHRRPWRTATVPGSLHPPVAAAMARLADLRPRQVVVDACCGAGTVAVEAVQQVDGLQVAGGDIDPAALRAAATNAARVPWTRWDAARLPFGRASVDRILVNPPWGGQAPHVRRPDDLVREWHRVLRPDGLVACLVPESYLDHLTGGRWEIRSVHPVSLAGRHPRIVVARPGVQPSRAAREDR